MRFTQCPVRRPRSLTRSRAVALPLVGLLLLAALAGAGCGGDDDDGGGDVSLAELKSSLPAAADLGLEPGRDFEWDNATDFMFQGPFFPEGTTPSELIADIDAAGFEGAVGSHLTDKPHKWNLSISVAEFDSDEGAVEARDRLHEEDLKQPCFAACAVTPREYELDGIPDSTAVHQVPNEGKPPPGVFEFESYLAEFVIGPQLYVVQSDGPPDWTSSTEFDQAVTTVYEAASQG